MVLILIKIIYINFTSVSKTMTLFWIFQNDNSLKCQIYLKIVGFSNNKILEKRYGILSF